MPSFPHQENLLVDSFLDLQQRSDSKIVRYSFSGVERVARDSSVMHCEAPSKPLDTDVPEDLSDLDPE